jgi:hypothetical protein
MDMLQRFEQLAAAARREAPPAIDVTARVMARIRRQVRPEARRADNITLAVMAVVSVLAASIVAVVAMDAWSAMIDPMSSLFQPLSVVMQ